MKVFFDAHDVIDIVKGYEALYRDPNYTGFRESYFNSERFFVQTLASGKKIAGPISMLPPHQEEFSSKFTDGFGVDKDQTLGEEDLTSLIYETKTFRDQRQWLKTRKGKKKELNIANRAKEGIPNYKVAMAVFKTSWKARVRQFFRVEPIFKIWNEEIPLEEYVVSAVCKKLITAINDIRPGSIGRTNNFNDALALTHLHHLVDDFNAGKSDTIPLFFDSTGLFREVVDQAGLEAEYLIRREGVEKSSILRDAKYFIVHSIFSKRHNGATATKELLEHYDRIEEYKTKFAGLERVGTIQSFMEFNSEIEQYINLNFLRHIMIDSYANDSLKSIFDQMNIDTETYKDQNFITELDTDVEKLKVELLESIDDVFLTQQLWESIHQGVEWLREHVTDSGQRTRPVSVWRDLGLIRFSIPVNTVLKVEKLMEDDGILSSDEDTVKNASVGLLSLLIEGVTKKGKSESLITGLACLWALGRYPEVIRQSVNYKNHHFSMGLIRGSAILKAGEGDLEEVLEIIQWLEKKAPKHPDLKPNIYIGVASLCFHYWMKENEMFSVNGIIPEAASQGEYSLKAINYSRKAKDLLNNIKDLEHPNEHYFALLRLWALNLYIYYCIEGGDKAMFKESRKIINAFIRYKHDSDFNWHYRFDDTIARYYHRISEMLPHDRLIHLKHAKEYASLAAKNPIGDVDRITRDYLAALDIVISEAKLEG